MSVYLGVRRCVGVGVRVHAHVCSGFIASSCTDMTEFIFEEWIVGKVSLFVVLFRVLRLGFCFLNSTIIGALWRLTK